MLVRFYAVGRELSGTDEAQFDVASFADLAVALDAQFGERMARLATASTLLLHGTRHRISDDVNLAADDVVDLLPPFAGG